MLMLLLTDWLTMLLLLLRLPLRLDGIDHMSGEGDAARPPWRDHVDHMCRARVTLQHSNLNIMS